MKKSCNVLIYGSGAVGSIFGWRVAQHGHSNVSVVCRSNYDCVKQAGFSLQTKAWGEGRFFPKRVYPSSTFQREAPAQRFDYVICANKFTHDHESILRDLRRVVHPETTLVSAQNGMDVELPLRQAFPDNTILSAICNIGCSQAAPGHIKQTAGLSPSAFLIGVYGESRYGGRVDASRRDTLVALDTKFASVEDVSKQRWRKLVFNCTFNALSCITNSDTHGALRDPEACKLASQLASEACTVARAVGVDLGDDYAESVIELARTSLPITPSTLQDARSRRPMEVGSIWGYLVSQATALGIEIPVTGMVFEVLERMNHIFSKERKFNEASEGLLWNGPRESLSRLALPANLVRSWFDPGPLANRNELPIAV